MDTGQFLKDQIDYNDDKKPNFAIDLLSHYTAQANKHFGFGRHVIAVAFIYPSLYNRGTKHTKTVSKLQQSHTLIITICLLLSGDIHQCPGPLNKPAEDGPRTAFTTRRSKTTFSQSTVEGPESARVVAANLTGASVNGDGMLSWAGPGVLVSAPAEQSASVECLGAAGALPGSAARTPSHRVLSSRTEHQGGQSACTTTENCKPS
ncbi:hypothetical protein AAFF_G00184240 [Aldrovandia affinis]|uniref:Uncharacterized protein n=1 Tax=Aldrovandia affinis TaxID=143900 RepID=A0AAD7RKL5_9TELE|nr:hypothetical protein AAFF_G00184240 [Aldrovandia affinis]